ncbi:MAG: hypothetical protein HYZ87_00190, partial [Candidatus Omnitrophica bacterium]|nr:hypothetical protein [Candidatus Omnitrophota bacterium]
MDAPLRKTSTFRRETTTLKSETYFLGEKGDEKASRTFLYNYAGSSVKSTNIFNYNPSTGALDSSVLYRVNIPMGSSPLADALRRTETHYAGDENEEVTDTTQTFDSLGALKETTYSYYAGAVALGVGMMEAVNLQGGTWPPPDGNGFSTHSVSGWRRNLTENSLLNLSASQLDYSVTLSGTDGLKINFDAINSGTLPATYTDFIIEIFVDGVSQGTANIKASDSDWQSSEITLKNLAAGDHAVSLRWQNDFYVPGVYDANLKLKNLSFNEIAPARASPLLADAPLVKTITFRGSTTVKRSETLFTGDKNEEKADRSFLYDYTGGTVKSTNIFTYDPTTHALESSIVYRGHVTGSAPTDPAQKRSAAFYAGDVEGEEILNTVQTYSRGLVLDTTRYYYGDSLLPASDPGAWDAP